MAIPASWEDLLCYAGAAGLLYGAVTLIGPILRPTIISFPWPEEERKHNSKQTVVLAGSFNPPHKGHLAMLMYLAERCVLYVA